MNKNGNLFSSFPIPALQDWLMTASGEIGGGDALEKLRWNTPDELSFRPLYTSDDITNAHATDFNFETAIDARPWANMPSVLVANKATANKSALDHLTNESEGILFQLELPKVDFGQLLHGILWEHCTLSFITDNEQQITALSEYISAASTSKDIDGACYSRLAFALPLYSYKTRFRFHGTIVDSSTPVKELSQALTRATEVFNRLLDAGLPVEVAAAQIAFFVPLGSDLLSDVAKLKALRRLWAHIAEAYGLKGFSPADAYIHGFSEPSPNPKFQPHGNMLKSTVAILAGVCGGCNALTASPEDPDNAMMERIARNVSHILKAESQLNKVNDPFAGSYAIEAMTDMFVQSAWEDFQSHL